MRLRAHALASDALVETAARAELAASKSAVAAVVAGFLAAAGARAGVLLAPLTLLVAGVGAGGRAFDGRLRQPGLGTKRSRGLLPGERVAPAARVALPTTVAALSVALAYDGARTLTPLARVGVKAAREAGASRRAALLERVSRVGPGALAEAIFVQPLLHVASPAEGGLLTPADFTGPPDVSVDARISRNRDGVTLDAPWANDEPSEKGSEGHAACAVDARGVFAALCYREITDGQAVDELELEVSFGAVPVRRGEPRVRPGERLPAPAPATIRCDAALTPLEVRVRREPNARRTLSIARGSGRWLEASTR
jgi:gamma-glutamyltranspeptidase/glutathione hydrolase